MRTKFLIVLLLSIFTQWLQARSFDFNDEYRQAYLHIIALRFNEGKTLIEKQVQSNPENLIPLVLENYIDFLRLFISEDVDDFNGLAGNRSLRLSKLSEGDASSPYFSWSLAMVNLHWAFVRLKFGEQLTAAREIRRAFVLLEENERRFPDFVPNQIGLGLLQALVGSIPPQYQWVARLASMHGTVVEGRDRLYRVLELTNSQQDLHYLQPECLFFLAFIEMNLMPDKEGVVQLLNKLQKVDDKNLLLSYIKANLQMHSARNDEAILTLQSRPQSDNYFPFPYLDYLLAEAYLRKLQTDQASAFYLRYLEHFGGINYRQDALRKLAWIELLSGNEAEYSQLMDLVRAAAPGQVDADRQALREAALKVKPNPLLLRMRLLFDGGYFHDALQLAKDGHQQYGKHEQLEFVYRLGRIYHEMGDHKQAITQYERTLNLGRNNPAYYAANAALKLGEIYELNGEYTAATENYRICLSLRPDEYRTSIHQKARAALSRISDK
jgi:tetratricopeptide (TPR) repeat protein